MAEPYPPSRRAGGWLVLAILWVNTFGLAAGIFSLLLDARVYKDSVWHNLAIAWYLFGVPVLTFAAVSKTRRRLRAGHCEGGRMFWGIALLVLWALPLVFLLVGFLVFE